MTFAELLKNTSTAATLADARKSYQAAIDESHRLYISQIETTNDHAGAERAYDRRNDDLHYTWLDRGGAEGPSCCHGLVIEYCPSCSDES